MKIIKYSNFKNMAKAPKLRKSYRFRDREPIKLSDGLSSLFSEYRMVEKLDIAEIKNKWQEIMGSAISNKTKSIDLYNGVLRINLDSPILKQELGFAKDKIRDHLNNALGKNIINSVVLY